MNAAVTGDTGPRTMAERIGALKNLPPFLRLVWQTSPAITLASGALRLVRALLPVDTLYVGAQIIDAVVRIAKAPPGGTTLDAWLASGKLDPVITLLLLEFGLAVLSDVLGRAVSLLDCCCPSGSASRPACASWRMRRRSTSRISRKASCRIASSARGGRRPGAWGSWARCSARRRMS